MEFLKEKCYWAFHSLVTPGKPIIVLHMYNYCMRVQIGGAVIHIYNYIIIYSHVEQNILVPALYSSSQGDNWLARSWSRIQSQGLELVAFHTNGSGYAPVFTATWILSSIHCHFIKLSVVRSTSHFLNGETLFLYCCTCKLNSCELGLTSV